MGQHLTGGEAQRIADHRRIEKGLPHFNLEPHAETIEPLEVGAMHYRQRLFSQVAPGGLAVLESKLQGRITGEQLVRALAAESDPIAVAMNSLCKMMVAEAVANH